MPADQTTAFHPDRLFPAEAQTRQLARDIYAQSAELPILSPHGHTDPWWFAENKAFANPTQLLLTPDHYLFRMLYSQGIPLEKLCVGLESPTEDQLREAWQCFAEHFYLFRGTPSAMWLKHVFYSVFGLNQPFGPETATEAYDRIQAALQTPEFLPRALLERFNIELISTTDAPTDDLKAHHKINQAGLKGRVIPCFRPDNVVDPEHEHFERDLNTLSEMTQLDCQNYHDYLDALRQRRQDFIALGATSTDHGHPSAITVELSEQGAEKLFRKIRSGNFSAHEAELFRGHMLMQMAQMSLEDGLVMQLHPGSYRNHNSALFKQLGRDLGADIPLKMEYTRALQPLLTRFGSESRFSFILFTLDESTYSRELAPLAGHYPALKLGPAWWFHDSPEGMRRFREMTTETAGFYNTVGFNDDTRAFFSIPARHDLARRMDAGFLARLVAEHRLDLDEACELAQDLAYAIVKRSYNL